MTNSKAIDISPQNDGKVMKEIIKEGVGDELPAQGAKVKVHYVGKLTDGTKFDSSRDRGEPFEFNLGKGSVIKAWDVGVATMRKGEVALLTCASDFAYGSAGSPPKIPPNATLVFEVEVIDWTGEDLSPKKDESIVRYTITAGDGFSSPNDGALVDIHIVGMYDGKKFEEKDALFNLGEGIEHGIVEGVEKALEKFKKGEKSRLVIKSDFAFKSEGHSAFNIPPNATVEYIVTLKSFEKAKESWSLDSEERVSQSQLFKEKGTNYFKTNKFALAVKMYSKIVSFLEFEKDGDDVLVQERNNLLISAHLNIALCHLKLKDPILARDSCTAAIKLQANSEKAYFRRGLAYLDLCEPEQALNDFNEVLKLEPNNKAAITQIAICKRKIQEQKNKEKKIYANMFEKFAKRDTEKEQEELQKQPDVMKSLGEWGEDEREREPTDFEKENPNILMLNKTGEFEDM